MCPSRALLLVSSLAACATPTRIVATGTDTIVSAAAVADDLAAADVVAFGELHDTPAVHEQHLDLIVRLHARRPNLVIALEMFERDVQVPLLQYLNGLIDEDAFLEQARPWPNYARDYRPLIEFARRNGLVVLAANAPRDLAKAASSEGVAAVLGDPRVARETTAPEDDYWRAFQQAMASHGGTTSSEAMKRFYEAQCLKDDTMAETVVDYLRGRYKVGDRPLLVLVCGRMHSDHGRGAVARIKNRMPDLDIRVLSAETIEHAGKAVYTSPPDVGSYVIVAPAGPPRCAPSPAPPAAGGASPASNPEGLRPALGLMPDYAEVGGSGILVASVRDGGPAERAGIEPGDVLIALAGEPVFDVESYTEVLDRQSIGQTIAVRVRRAGAETVLQVEVGSRSR